MSSHHSFSLFRALNDEPARSVPRSRLHRRREGHPGPGSAGSGGDDGILVLADDGLGARTDRRVEVRTRTNEPKRADAQVLGISEDFTPSQKEFAEKNKLTFPLLSDFSKRQVAKDYGVLIPDVGIANRATFVVDKEGKIIARVPPGPMFRVEYRMTWKSSLPGLW